MALILVENHRVDRDRWPWLVHKTDADTLNEAAMTQMDQWCVDRLGEEYQDWRGYYHGWLFSDHAYAFEFCLAWS